MTKKKNYDKTGLTRMQKRRARIKESGLVERPIIMDAEDTPKIRKYAEKLYKKRGKKLTT